MKKIFKITILSIFSVFTIIVLFVAIEAFFCYRLCHVLEAPCKNPSFLETMQFFHYQAPIKYNWKNFKSVFRTKIGKSSKGAILFVGGSYLKGFGLKKDETFDSQVHFLTGRTTYKRPIPNGGAANVYNLFETQTIKKTVPDTEYIVYILTSLDLDTLNCYQLNYFLTLMNVRYKLQNNNVVKIQDKIKILNSLFTVKYFQILHEQFMNNYGIESNINLFLAIMRQLKIKSEELYPNNTKFILLLYPDEDFSRRNSENADETINIIEPEIIEELEKMGYIVINAENLTNLPLENTDYQNEYRLPTAKVWQSVSKGFVKKFEL